jgi:hypothetical protein
MLNMVAAVAAGILTSPLMLWVAVLCMVAAVVVVEVVITSLQPS